MHMGEGLRQAEGDEMTKHLRKGVHWVKMTGQHGKRKVRVDAKGRWHFMKGTRGGRCPTCHRKR